jgi:hypothetical protein
MIKQKKGVFFSLDALLALVIIFSATLVFHPSSTIEPRVSLVQGDIISVLSSLQIGEINDSYAQGLVASGIILDTNKSVLEILGELHVFNQTISQELAESIFSEISDEENFGIWFGDDMIISKNVAPYDSARKIVAERQIISGIQSGESVTAFSARAFLSNSLQNEYYYFGGYVGEGNISARIEYSGNITAAEIELAITESFDVYINDIYSGSFNGSSATEPVTYSLPIGNFVSGVNEVELRGDSLYVAGGFVKVTYEKLLNMYTPSSRYYFPGIDGAINLFDSFYSPGLITSMNIFLQFENNLTTFLNIGNVTVYNGSTAGVESITINDATLSSILDYSSLSQKTIPLRFGIENASYITNISKSADVYSVTDLSGSMDWQCSNNDRFWCQWSQGFCEGCGGTWSLDAPLEIAKDANELFIEILLGYNAESSTTNKIGLIGYKDDVSPSYYHELSTDDVSLNSEIDTWSASGGTCICCGINNATDELVAFSSESNFRSMVVMSDGAANGECDRQNNGTAALDAIQAACDAYNDYGLTVYAVGFGEGADEDTLHDIAACGGGSYYYSSTDIETLAEVYEGIAGDILNATFSEQTLVVSGNYTSKLFSNSYIEYNYNSSNSPFGLITTTEKSFDDAGSGSFILPPNSSILEAKVVSYSGSKWTDHVWINDNITYNLSVYGQDYLSLGDPYSVNIPNSEILSINFVNLTVGLSPANSSEGSESNKIIYKVLQENLAAYSSLAGVADGCRWTLEFNSGNSSTISVPEDYSGSEECYYTTGGQNISNSNDAIQEAVLELLGLIDFDSDGSLDVGFGDQDLQISSSQIADIPYDWSTEIQVRTWV